MASLTIAIDDGVLRQARMRAVAQGTSVNAVLRRYLEAYSGTHDERAQAIRTIFEISDRCQSGRGDVLWTRDELHER
jgi:plasmid stability protein